MQPQGRLELTWANKHLRLLSHGSSTYEWCDPSDFRVSEVRLLHEVEVVGEPADNLLIEGDAMHALDALLRTPELASRYVGKVKCCYIDPPFNTGKVFSSYDDALEHSVWLTLLRDRLQQIHRLLSADGTLWLHLDNVEVHRARAVLDEVFGADNFVADVVWQKADSPRSDAGGFSISHDTLLVYRKSAAWTPNWLPRLESTDAKFGSQDGDPVLWRKKDPTAPSAASHQGMVYAVQHPIGGHLVYPGVGRCWAMEQSWMVSEMSRYARYELRDIGDESARAHICGVDPSKVRAGVKALMLADPLEKASAQARRVYDAGSWPTVYLTGPGGQRGFQRKQYISDAGRVPDTWWSHDQVGHNRSAKNEIKALFTGEHPFATPKPERLLQRVISIATDEGDLVLDCFAGSGTTGAVAHKMKRRWVTVELSSANVTNYVLPRLRKVVAGTDDGGVTTSTREVFEGDLPDGTEPALVRKAAALLGDLYDHGVFDQVEGVDEKLVKKLATAMRRASKVRAETTRTWTGGGGFRRLAVGPSMFEEVDGFVVLSEWATAGGLAESVAAQLGYAYEPAPPFAGRKGRSRLAVIDGVLSPDLVRHLVELLDETERLLAVAQAVEPECEELVRTLRPGSRVRKVPRDLARVGVRPGELVTLTGFKAPADADEASEEQST